MSSAMDRRRRQRRREEAERAAAQRRLEEKMNRSLAGEGMDCVSAAIPTKNDRDSSRRSDHFNQDAMDFARYLIKRGANITASDDYFMRWAASNNRLDVMKFLRKHGATLGIYNNYPARYALINNNLDMLEWLQDQGAHVTPQRDRFFEAAAARGDIKTLDRIKARNNINLQINYILNTAARYGKLRVLKWFDKNGASVRFNNGEIMSSAVDGGHIPTLNWLEKQAVAVNAILDIGIVTPAQKGNLTVFKWLDDRKVSMDFNKAAFYAAAEGHVPLLQWLYEKGAQLHQKHEAHFVNNGKQATADFLIAQRYVRNAPLVNAAIAEAIAESKTTPPLSLTQRTLRKFGF